MLSGFKYRYIIPFEFKNDMDAAIPYIFISFWVESHDDGACSFLSFIIRSANAPFDTSSVIIPGLSSFKLLIGLKPMNFTIFGWLIFAVIFSSLF